MKYRNKDTGVIVEAMHVEPNMSHTIFNFGKGLISSIGSAGLSPEIMNIFKLELKFPYIDQFGEHKVHTHYIDCQVGDYLIKKDTSIFALHEKEFEKYFELVKEENNNMENKKRYLDLEGALSIAGIEGQQIKHKDWDNYMCKNTAMDYIVFLINKGKLDPTDIVKKVWEVGYPTDEQENNTIKANNSASKPIKDFKDAKEIILKSLSSIAQDKEMAIEDKLFTINSSIDGFCSVCEQILKNALSTSKCNIKENNNMKININDEVKVRLTNRSLEILKEKHKALNRIILKNGGKPDKFPYKPDENGYYTFQLWHLFEAFGEHISCGCESPFIEGEIIVDNQESHIKDSKDIKAELPSSDRYNPIMNMAQYATTLKTHERTVRDCILDMFIKDKVIEIQTAIETCFKDKANKLHDKIEYNPRADYLERYNKCFEIIKAFGSTYDVLRMTEKDAIKASKTGYDKFDYFISDVLKEAKCIKEKEGKN